MAFVPVVGLNQPCITYEECLLGVEYRMFRGRVDVECKNIWPLSFKEEKLKNVNRVSLLQGLASAVL